MAFLVDITRSDLPHDIINRPLILPTYPIVNVNLINLINTLTLYITVYAIKLLVPRLPSKFNMKLILKYNKRYSMVNKISHFISFWLASLNLFLIVIVTPCVVNPGPKDNNNISVISQRNLVG